MIPSHRDFEDGPRRRSVSGIVDRPTPPDHAVRTYSELARTGRVHADTGVSGSTQLQLCTGFARFAIGAGVAVVTMNRPQYRNAQNSRMTYALDAAFERAVADEDVRVIVLAGSGEHFQCRPRHRHA